MSPKKISRRMALAWVGALACLASLRKANPFRKESRSLGNSQPSASQKLQALKAMQLLNTAEMSFFKEFREFAPINNIHSFVKDTHRFPDGFGFRSVSESASFLTGNDFVPGFRLLSRTDDKRHYRFILHHQGTDFAYMTDEAGVIYEAESSPQPPQTRILLSYLSERLLPTRIRQLSQVGS